MIPNIELTMILEIIYLPGPNDNFGEHDWNPSLIFFFRDSYFKYFVL